MKDLLTSQYLGVLLIYGRNKTLGKNKIAKERKGLVFLFKVFKCPCHIIIYPQKKEIPGTVCYKNTLLNKVNF